MSGRAILQRKKTVQPPQQTLARATETPSPAAPAAPSAGHNIGEIPIEAATAYELSEPGDRLEREADRVAEQVLSTGGAAPPRPPTISPASPSPANITDVARQEANASQEATGGSEGIDAVLQSDGQPLDGSSRMLLEPRFGHDFGNVRVHTDARAAASAQSLRALAYTVGDNIVFGNGQYTPETDAGKYLIAHELTHVMQQQTIGSGRNPAARMVQRITEEEKKPTWGNVIIPPDNSNMSLEPSAQLFLGEAGTTPGLTTNFPGLPGAAQEELKLPEGTASGRVVITVKSSWFRNVWSGNQEGKGSVTAEARFKVSPDNKIEWQGAALPTYSSEGAGASTTGTANASGDTLAVTPTINGVGTVGDTSTSTVSVAPGGLGGSKAEGKTVALPAGSSMSKTYSVRLTPAPIPMESHTFTTYFEVGSDVMEQKSKMDVVVWYEGLPLAIRKSIEDGVTEVMFIGHASTTGPVDTIYDFNQKLSARRNATAMAILRGHAGSKAKLEHKDRGFADDPNFDVKSGKLDSVEDASQRFVEIQVSYLNKPGSAPAGGAGAPKP
jgi:hypothetical protein